MLPNALEEEEGQKMAFLALRHLCGWLHAKMMTKILQPKFKYVHFKKRI